MPDLLKHLETRSQASKIHYSDPTSTREWIVWRSRDRDEILAHLTSFNLPPALDTVANIPRYLRDAELNEVGNGVWKYKANYAKDPNTTTIEINYTGGTKKMLQSLGLVSSYSCDTVASNTSLAATEAAIAANDALNLQIPTLEASVAGAITLIATAVASAGDPLVDTTVRLLCIDAIDSATNAKNHANVVLQMASLVEAAVSNAINAAQIGDYALAASSAASAQDHYDVSATSAASAVSDAADAASAAALAVSAASGGSTESIDAADAATDAANAAGTVATDAETINDFIADAANAAQDIADALAADAAGGIPNFGTMVNITDKGVDGVEIEDEKCEITVTKTFVATTLASGYLETLRSMSPSKNNAEFAINYKGQIVVYKTGELKFKNFTYKQDGDNTIVIVYYLASSRNITEADNQTIGNSPAIVKEGWDYLSIFYVESVDAAAFCKSKKPKAAYVHRVYRPMDFSLLQLGI